MAIQSNKTRNAFENHGFSTLNLYTKLESNINRIQIGQTLLNSNLFKLKITLSNLCKCNKEKKRVEHTFWQCEL